MEEKVLDWLLEDDNPAVKYRAQTDLLGQNADNIYVKEWIFSKLPVKWFEVKGLWYVYYVTALAECGLHADDIPNEHLNRAFELIEDFQYGCADFMLLRAMIMLGLHEHAAVQNVIGNLQENALPDGGYLCVRRRNGFKYVPKSCYKADIFALMFLAESQKAGMDIGFGRSLINYFLDRNILYKSTDKTALVLECSKDTFHPFEPMRVGIHNIVESFSALGYGNDERLCQAWTFLNNFRNENGLMILHRTLVKSYLPKEKPGSESKWVTFYALLAEKNRDRI